MSALKYRAFMIMIRPCFVKNGVNSSGQNIHIVVQYDGPMYREPMLTDDDPEFINLKGKRRTGSPGAYTVSSTSEDVPPNSYKACIRIPRINTVVPINTNADINGYASGGGIERTRYITDETAEAARKMPRDKGASVPENKYNTNIKSHGSLPLNDNEWFSEDIWMLHSTWTSFEACKNYVRYLADIIGFKSVMVCHYIDLDTQLLPIK